jgi:hypothetical protein
MRRIDLKNMALTVFLAAATSCGDDGNELSADDGGPPVCDPGETQLCECEGGLSGIQTCNGDGQWGECECDGGNPNQDPCGDSILFVIDRSSSMDNDGKWDDLKSTFTTVLGEFGDATAFGLEVYPDDSCDDTYDGDELSIVCRGPDNLLVDIADGSAQSIMDSMESVGTCGGTPTAPALQKALTTAESYSGEVRVVLVTDGLPNCDADADGSECECPVGAQNLCEENPALCLDDLAAYEAAIDLRDAGAPVHVIAFDTYPEWSDVFDQLAGAGGTDEAFFCADPAELEGALDEILTSVAEC